MKRLGAPSSSDVEARPSRPVEIVPEFPSRIVVVGSVATVVVEGLSVLLFYRPEKSVTAPELADTPDIPEVTSKTGTDLESPGNVQETGTTTLNSHPSTEKPKDMTAAAMEVV